MMLQPAMSWSTGSQLARIIAYQPATPCHVRLTSSTHVSRPLTTRRILTKVSRQPVERRQVASCSAVVDRPQESDLSSAGLGWPKGFHTRYELREQLGKGSFGTVYLATNIVTGQEVAAKIIPKERKGTTTEHILEKIQQEVFPGSLSDFQHDCWPIVLQVVGSLLNIALSMGSMLLGRCSAAHARAARDPQAHIRL